VQVPLTWGAAVQISGPLFVGARLSYSQQHHRRVSPSR